jgi:hypothetical protein
MEKIKADYCGRNCEMLVDRLGMVYIPYYVDKSVKVEDISQFENCKTAQECKQRGGKGTVKLLCEILLRSTATEYELLEGNKYKVEIVDINEADEESKEQYTKRPKLGKRCFGFDMAHWNEITNQKIPNVLDCSHPLSVYANSIQEAVNLEIEQNIEYLAFFDNDNIISLDGCNEDMLIFSDDNENSCGLYEKGDKPYTTIDGNKFIYGIKKGNETLEWYKIIKDKSSAKGYRCVLARTDRVEKVYEYIEKN